MKVLYDAQIFDNQKFGGISRCFVENYRHLPSSVDAKISVLESDNYYLQNIGYLPMGTALDNFITKKHFPYKRKLFRLYNRLTGGLCIGPEENIEYSKKLIVCGDYDVFHPTYFDDYFLEYLNGKQFVLTIHDMIPEKFPQYYSNYDEQILGKQKLAPLAARIIAVSETTKKDIVEILNIPPEKIDVVYHGCDRTLIKQEEVNVTGGEPYILFVGHRSAYKNFMWMCERLLPVFNANPELHMVCAGKMFSDFENEWIRNNGLSRRFHTVSPSDDFLFSLYQGAEFFIYPSDYEGFGIPILEAYAAGCPVLLNNASCFPEIAGDAAVYFQKNDNQSDLTDVAQFMLEMDRSARQELIEMQNSRLNLYSWEDSAHKLAKVYESVL